MSTATMDHTALAAKSNPTKQRKGRSPRQLLLLGAGLAHIQVLQRLAEQPLEGVHITLVAPQPHLLHPALIAGFVAARLEPQACAVPLGPLVRKAAVRWLERNVRSLNPEQSSVSLDDGTTLQYDWLSVNLGVVQNRIVAERHLPGAREHGLFLRPFESFAPLWSRVAALGVERPLRIAVIGAGVSSVELALAVRQRLPNACVTLLSRSAHVAGPLARQRVLAALKQRNITVLQESVLELNGREVRLGCGATLACDVPVLTSGARPPRWLAGSGLAIDAQGFIATDACLRSTSHPAVFVTGDICTRAKRPLDGNVHQALQCGTALAANLAACVAGKRLQRYRPSSRALVLLSCADGTAIGGYGLWSGQGRVLGWLKSWLERRFLQKFIGTNRQTNDADALRLDAPKRVPSR